MVMEVVHEDAGEANIQCINHPYKNSTPSGGICAFCLQEKLGKLVSSSFSLTFFPSSPPSSSPPSFGSDFTAPATNTTTPAAIQVYSRRSRLPFVLVHRRKKKDGVAMDGPDSSTSIVFKRSKSTTTPRRGGGNINLLENGEDHKKGFWSFFYLSRNSTPTAKKGNKQLKGLNFTSPNPNSKNKTTVGSAVRTVDKKREEFVVVDENPAPIDRKVSRSRSVGCGSRSFSGDFFERISNGFGDCTLRRVESQREGKAKVRNNGQPEERVKCGGIFSGFMITSSSVPITSTAEDRANKKGAAELSSSSVRHNSHCHGRSRSWGWAFASPMRAFGKSSFVSKRDSASTKGMSSNLAAMPSLLAVSG